MSKRIIYIISAILNIILLFVLSIMWISALKGDYYVSDNNTWRIFSENHHLFIGDFWVSLFLVWYPIKGITSLLDNISNRLEEVLKTFEEN